MLPQPTNTAKASNDLVIDWEQIRPPSLFFSARALKELHNILQNDFTLEDKYLRIQISGKGCDGFDYQIGFDQQNKDDRLFPIENDPQKTFILFDAFSAHFGKDIEVDFIQDFNLDIQGFVVKSNDKGEYRGKFWKENPESAPPLRSRQ